VTWLGALRRSYELTRGSFWHVFGVIFIVGFLGAIVGNLGAIALRSSATWLQVIVGIAVLTITLLFTALSTAVLFYDLLARRHSAGGARA
jgi:uncharacterized membrane protein YhaH (DUF805 family)